MGRVLDGQQHAPQLDPARIKYVYFGVLCGYLAFGLLMLSVVPRPDQLVKIATNIMNFRLRFQLLAHTGDQHHAVPPALRPGGQLRIGLLLSGHFFWRWPA